MDYEHPIPLSGDILKQRIFSPLAYARVRRTNVVAVAASEVPRYAAHYPVAWRKRGSVFELSIVRSFISDGRGHPPGTQNSLAFLPNILRAYPFLLSSPKPDGARSKLVDTAIADEPNDVGAPICMVDGRPSKATTQRITLLETTAPMVVQTEAISAQLAERDLYEPWPLHFEDVEGHTLDVADMWIVRQDAVNSGALAPILRQHGVLAADLIALHRLSLFRAGMLLAHARGALKATAEAIAPRETVAAAKSGEGAAP